jgi:hypothetical protein
VVVPAAALFTTLSTFGASAAPGFTMSGIAASALAQTSATPSISSLIKGALTVMAWNKAKTGITAAILILFLGGSAVAIWNWQAHDRTARSAVGPILSTFEPMAGEWDGTITLRRDGNLIANNQPCSMSVTTQQGGRQCDIELRLQMVQGGIPCKKCFATPAT